jgi:hypothetical protein
VELDGHSCASQQDDFLRQLKNRKSIPWIADIEVFPDCLRPRDHLDQGVTEILNVAPRTNLRAVSMDFEGPSGERVEYEAADGMRS